MWPPDRKPSLSPAGRVLRNLLGIQRVRDMQRLESQALEIAQDDALGRFGSEHRFTARDLCELHSLWLDGIYAWAGHYRTVNIGKGGFQFAHAELILIHPYREGNGRLARLLAALMAMQAGLPALDFRPMLGRGRDAYIGGIHAALGRDYRPLAGVFERVIAASRRCVAARAR